MRGTLFLDTNTIFYLLGISSNDSIDISLLKKTVKNKPFAISLLTLFEIYNNPHINVNEIFNKLNSFSDFIYIVNLSLAEIPQKYVDLLMNPIEDINSKVIKTLSLNVIDLISKEYAYIIILICMFYPYEFLSVKDKYDNFQRIKLYELSVDHHMHHLRDRISRNINIELTKHYKKRFFILEKELTSILKRYLLNIVSQFVPFHNRAYTELEKNNFEYISYHMLKKWYVNQMNIISFNSFLEFKEKDFDNMNIYKHIIPSSKFKVSFVQFIEIILRNTDRRLKKDNVEMLYLEKHIKNIFIGQQKFKYNHIIDKEIIKTFYSDVFDNSCRFITFDKDIHKIMKNINLKKSRESLKLINSLYK